VPNDAANVLKTIENLTGVESNLKLNVASLKNLRVQKDAIESAIKNTLTNIIKSKIAGAVQEGLNNIKKYF
jgi:predicted translin family RNA/ssDNA-binding protein